LLVDVDTLHHTHIHISIPFFLFPTGSQPLLTPFSRATFSFLLPFLPSPLDQTGPPHPFNS
jgi:hypothetical protein